MMLYRAHMVDWEADLKSGNAKQISRLPSKDRKKTGSKKSVDQLAIHEEEEEIMEEMEDSYGQVAGADAGSDMENRTSGTNDQRERTSVRNKKEKKLVVECKDNKISVGLNADTSVVRREKRTNMKIASKSPKNMKGNGSGSRSSKSTVKSGMFGNESGFKSIAEVEKIQQRSVRKK